MLISLEFNYIRFVNSQLVYPCWLGFVNRFRDYLNSWLQYFHHPGNSPSWQSTLRRSAFQRDGIESGLCDFGWSLNFKVQRFCTRLASGFQMCEVSYPFAFNFNSVTFAVFGSIVIVLVFSKIYCEFPGCMGFTVAFKPLSFVKRGINRKDNFEINWVTRMPKKRYCVLRPKKKTVKLSFRLPEKKLSCWLTHSPPVGNRYRPTCRKR